MRVLLVDDDYLLAKGTAKLLERMGNHQVTITEDPDEIFQLCQSKAVDLVLMDVNLPAAMWVEDGIEKEVSGTDLSRLLKADPDTTHIPIILITAYAMLTERQKILNDARADDFFAKPIIDYQTLLATMKVLYDKAA
jgi:two-component system, cell cycle response regulator DivK